MKCAIAVLCCLVMSVQCSIVHWPGAVVLSSGHLPAAVDVHDGKTVALHAAVVPAHLHSVQLITHPVVLHPVVVPATYVAKTPGSEHVAPLPGHTQSASSVNLEPAPGSE